MLFGSEKEIVAHGPQPCARPQAVFHVDQLPDVIEEPAIDLRRVMDVVHGEAGFHGVAEVPGAFRIGRGQLGEDFIQAGLLLRSPTVGAVAAQAKLPCLQAAEGLLERLFEGPPDGHRLADRLHLGRQRRVRVWEFLKVPPRDLGDDIIDSRLETGRRLARDVVSELIEPVADR